MSSVSSTILFLSSAQSLRHVIINLKYSPLTILPLVPPQKGVAFLGMIIQLPLIAFTKRFEKPDSPAKKMIGNCIFWVTFTTFGQPFAALCYFYAWQIKYGSISEKWSSNARAK